MQVPNATYIDGLVTMHCALGVRYIIGLPLYQNAPQLTLAVKNAFDTAFARFPKAILSYELGNEPNFWPTKEGGFSPAVNPTRCSSVTYNDPSFQLVATLQPVTGPADKAAGTTTAVRIEKTDGKDRRKLLETEGEEVEAATAVAEIAALQAEAARGFGVVVPPTADALPEVGNGLIVQELAGAPAAAAAVAAADLMQTGAPAEEEEGLGSEISAAAPAAAAAAGGDEIADEETTTALSERAPEVVEDGTNGTVSSAAAATAAAEPAVETAEANAGLKGGPDGARAQAADEDTAAVLVEAESAQAKRSLKQVAEMPYVPTFALYRPYQRPWTPYFPQGFCFTQQVTQFRSGFPAYLEYFNKTANAITGCGGPQTAEQVAWGVPYWGPPGFSRKTISGPSWGNLNIGAENFSNFVRNAGAR